MKTTHEIAETLVHNFKALQDYQGVALCEIKTNASVKNATVDDILKAREAIEKGIFEFRTKKKKISFQGKGNLFSYYNSEADDPRVYERMASTGNEPAIEPPPLPFVLKGSEMDDISPLFFGYGAIGAPNHQLTCLGYSIGLSEEKKNITLAMDTLEGIETYKIEILTLGNESKIILWIDPAQDYRVIRQESGKLLHDKDSGSLYLMEEERINQFKYDPLQQSWLPAQAIYRQYQNYPFNFGVTPENIKDLVQGNLSNQKVLKEETIYQYETFEINKGIKDLVYTN